MALLVLITIFNLSINYFILQIEKFRHLATTGSMQNEHMEITFSSRIAGAQPCPLVEGPSVGARAFTRSKV